MFVSHDTDTASAVQSGVPIPKLIGLTCATQSKSITVTDADMALPLSPDSGPPAGRTICLHSLAMLPAYQKRGLGRMLLKVYLQRMASAGIADRLAILSHEPLLPYYESFGFRTLGPSTAKFGGGGWFDLVMDFTPGPVRG